jgi:hypothetical protein
MTKKSSPTRLPATWLKQAATRAGQCGSWLLISTVSVGWFLMALLVLLPWLALDFLPSRKGSKPLTSPTRPPRKLPRLYRDGSDVFLWMPDGTTVPLEPLEVSILVENISSVASGAYVYEKTRIKLDADG